jgi:glucose/arabinose dehydrogenase
MNRPFEFITVVILAVSMSYSIIFLLNINYFELVNASENQPDKLPVIHDSSLKIELIFKKEIDREGGTLSPVSSIAFLNTNDFLVLNKNEGTVNRFVNGVLLEEPLLDVNVANKRERGMLGIAVTSSSSSEINERDNARYVFLYYTETENRDGSDICRATYYCKSDTETLGNHLYRYELKDDKLVNPKLLLQLPSWPAPAHNGGVVIIGPDNNLYITIGDLVGSVNETSRTKAQNYKNGTEPDGRAGILSLTQQGKHVSEPALSKKFPLNLYYAYGIRNSFGIDFDPVSQKLWDTENGPDYGDEINLVEPGFNSGWHQVQGIWDPVYDPVRGGDLIAGEELLNPGRKDLVDFNGKGKYSRPEFTWNQTVGPTQIKFLHSDKYPKEFMYDLFVGDTNNGYLYHFNLNEDRTSLHLNGSLKDNIANSNKELKDVIIGEGFGQITDLEISPDGYLHILSHDKNMAMIYKITSKN